MKLCPDCKRPKVAAYARISDDQKGERLGIGDQIEDCWTRAGEEEWCRCTPELDTFSDNDIGALKRKPRPGYIALQEAIRLGRYGTLIARDDSRLTRNMGEAYELVELVEQKKLKVVLLWTAHWDLSTASGRKRVRDSFSDAQYEAERTGERVARARLRDAKLGKPMMGGSLRPWGFEEDRITHVPAEADEIRDAARRLIAGESLNSVCQRVDKRPNMVKRVLCSPRIAGYREHRGTLYPAVWEPILDADTWEAVKAIITLRKVKGAPGGSERKYLLTGFLECHRPMPDGSVCGGKVCGCTNHIGPAYRCNTCGGSRRTAEPLERHVIAQLFDRLDANVGTQVERKAEDAGITEKIHGYEARLEQAYELFMEGVLSKDEYARAKVDLVDRLNEARGKVAESAARVWTPVDPKIGKAAWWAKLDLLQKRAVLAEHLDGPIFLVPAKRGKPYDTNSAVIRWKEQPAQ